MAIGTASALAPYNYQTAVSSYGQGSNATSSSATSGSSNAQDAAALQALVSAYSGLASNSNGFLPAPDTLASLAGSSGALGSLASGIYKLSAANGNTTPDLSALSATAASVGGLNATAASILFAGTGSQGRDNLTSSAINMNTVLALTAYSNQLNNIPNGTLGAAATAAASNINPNQPADVQTAIQGAQTSLFRSTLNLLA